MPSLPEDNEVGGVPGMGVLRGSWVRHSGYWPADGPVNPFPGEDLRDIVADAWSVIAERRLLRYITLDSPDFMNDSVKNSGERAFMISLNIRYQAYRDLT